MENLGAMAYSRYTGFREITDRDVLELHCICIVQPNRFQQEEYHAAWCFRLNILPENRI